MRPSIERVLDEVRAVDWSEWSDPAVGYLWAYDHTRVVPAFEALAAVSDEVGSVRAHHLVINALAHSHSGTPYQVLVPASGYLVRLVPLLDGWARSAGVEVLLDAYGFTVGDTEFRTVSGRVMDLTEVHLTVASLRDFLEQVAVDGSPASGYAALLLDQMDEIPPGSGNG
jgi:hypothetical protein